MRREDFSNDEDYSQHLIEACEFPPPGFVPGGEGYWAILLRASGWCDDQP